MYVRFLSRVSRVRREWGLLQLDIAHWLAGLPATLTKESINDEIHKQIEDGLMHCVKIEGPVIFAPSDFTRLRHILWCHYLLSLKKKIIAW
jgi:hypothetical protein